MALTPGIKPGREASALTTAPALLPLKSSRAIFENFRSSLEWLGTHQLKLSAVLHIADDFLSIASSKDKCSTEYTISLGVPIGHAKTVGPDTTLQFAGIELDSVRLEKVTVRKAKCQFLIKR